MIIDIDNFATLCDILHNGEVFPLYYDREQNIFMQEGGWVVHDIHTYLTPHELLIFKERKEDMIVQNPRHDFLIGVFYLPDEPDIGDDGTWEDYHEC